MLRTAVKSVKSAHQPCAPAWSVLPPPLTALIEGGEASSNDFGLLRLIWYAFAVVIYDQSCGGKTASVRVIQSNSVVESKATLELPSAVALPDIRREGGTGERGPVE